MELRHLFDSNREKGRKLIQMNADRLHSKADFVTVQEARWTNYRAAHLRSQLHGCGAEVFWTRDKDKPMSAGGILLIVRKCFLGQFE